MPCRTTILNWLRGHRRRSSTSSTEDEATRSLHSQSPKPKHKREKGMAQRSRRANSDGASLRSMRSFVALGGQTQLELATSAMAHEEERATKPKKFRRRSTIHAMLHDKRDEVERSASSVTASSPASLLGLPSPNFGHARQFSLGSKWKAHSRSSSSESPRAFTPQTAPSIIYIDC